MKKRTRNEHSAYTKKRERHIHSGVFDWMKKGWGKHERKACRIKKRAIKAVFQTA